MTDGWEDVLGGLRRANWQLIAVCDPDDDTEVNHIQIVPLNDTRSHDVDASVFCWCHPREDYGQDIPMVIHNAQDGRK